MRLSRLMTSVPLSRVTVTDPFWKSRQETLRTVSLPIQYQQCVETGRIENFRRAARGEKGTFEGRRYNDSDVYKWIEAVSYLHAALGTEPETEKQLDDTIAAIASAQDADGYLHTFFQVNHPDLKWRNLSMMHEMYCMGHLLEAAVAHHEAFGKRDLLDVAIRVADHIDSVFGPSKRKGSCGHQEIELALLRLAQSVETENPDRAKRYRSLAKWMVDTRGTRPSPFEEEYTDAEGMALAPYAHSMLDKDGKYSGEYIQDHLPLRDQAEVVGHAVRAMYFFTAATEAAYDQADAPIEAALERLWANLTQKRMYVTGGIGPAHHNEGFSTDYDLPNRTAYAETCASVALAFWSKRLLEGTGDSEYADVMERAIYNGALAGISLSGDRFFYVNPLESFGDHHRQPWFDCACCPPNIARLIASIGSYLLSYSSNAVVVHIPASFEASVPLSGGEVKVTVASNYPWSGNFSVTVSTPTDQEFELRVRIPDWCGDTGLETPDGFPEAEYENGYLVIKRTWSGKETVTVDLEMTPRWIAAHPSVLDCLGRSALACGPLIYCLEKADLGADSPQGVMVDTSDATVEDFEGELLGGISPISARGWADRYANWGDTLYGLDNDVSEPAEVELILIPYYAWDNREAGSMQVWLRRI